MNELLNLEEIQERSYAESLKIQSIVKRWFDKRKSSVIIFQEGDLVLKWDEDRAKPGKHKKFDSMWSRSYQIARVVSENAFELRRMDG